MAETGDKGHLNQVHGNTAEEKAAAVRAMRTTAYRVTARRKKSRQRAERDLETVLLLLGLVDEVPEGMESYLKQREKYWLMGQRTQFKRRSDDE